MNKKADENDIPDSPAINLSRKDAAFQFAAALNEARSYECIGNAFRNYGRACKAPLGNDSLRVIFDVMRLLDSRMAERPREATNFPIAQRIARAIFGAHVDTDKLPSIFLQLGEGGVLALKFFTNPIGFCRQWCEETSQKTLLNAPRTAAGDTWPFSD